MAGVLLCFLDLTELFLPFFLGLVRVSHRSRELKEEKQDPNFNKITFDERVATLQAKLLADEFWKINQVKIGQSGLIKTSRNLHTPPPSVFLLKHFGSFLYSSGNLINQPKGAMGDLYRHYKSLDLPDQGSVELWATIPLSGVQSEIRSSITYLKGQAKRMFEELTEADKCFEQSEKASKSGENAVHHASTEYEGARDTLTKLAKRYFETPMYIEGRTTNSILGTYVHISIYTYTEMSILLYNHTREWVYNHTAIHYS